MQKSPLISKIAELPNLDKKGRKHLLLARCVCGVEGTITKADFTKLKKLGKCNCTHKLCNKCSIEKDKMLEFCSDVSKIDGRATVCISCKKQYRQNNKEKVKITKQKWNAANKDKCKEHQRVGYEKHWEKKREQANRPRRENKEAYNETQRQYRKNNPEKFLKYREKVKIRTRYIDWWKRQLDTEWKIKKNLRIRLSKGLKLDLKETSAVDSLGCSILELKEKLIPFFKDDMAFDNYGKVWDLDHIIPMSFFDLKKKHQQEICCHYSNLQPLFKKDNVSKKNKILDVSKLLSVNVKIIQRFNED